METLHTIRKWLDKIVGTICILLFALMVVVGSYQIITRFVFNNPSTISEELLTYSFAWMAMFAVIVLIYGGFNIMGLTMTQKTASLGVMMGQVYAVVPVSGILIAIYGILNVVDLCKGYERKEEEEK